MAAQTDIVRIGRALHGKGTLQRYRNGPMGLNTHLIYLRLSLSASGMAGKLTQKNKRVINQIFVGGQAFLTWLESQLTKWISNRLRRSKVISISILRVSHLIIWDVWDHTHRAGDKIFRPPRPWSTNFVITFKAFTVEFFSSMSPYEAMRI